MKKGMIYVFTGEGKGKTSAALGVAMRAVGHKMKVGWISWYKEKSWQTGEMKLPSRTVLEGLEMHFVGKGFYKLPTDHATPKEHRAAGERGMKLAEKLIKKVEVLVLDEINNAIKDGLVEEKRVLELLENRGKTHVVMTGRDTAGSVSPMEQVLAIADLVTECKKIKHPFDKGVKAIKGLDY